MRTGAAPIAALLLVLTTSVIQVSAAADIYWEGEEDASNEFLEVKQHDPSLVDHLKRFKRQWSFWNPFGPAETTTTREDAADSVTESDDGGSYGKDDDQDSFGSGYVDRSPDVSEPKEKTLRVTFTVFEPYRKEYSDRDSKEFSEFSHSLASAVDALFEKLPGTQKASLVRIQSLVVDEFSCKVTLDIVTTGYDDTNTIEDLLRNHIKNNGRLGKTTVTATGFNAQLIDPAAKPQERLDEAPTDNPDDNYDRPGSDNRDDFSNPAPENYDPKPYDPTSYDQNTRDQDPYDRNTPDQDQYSQNTPDQDPYSSRTPEEDLNAQNTPDQDPYGSRAPDQDPYGEKSQTPDPYGQNTPALSSYDADRSPDSNPDDQDNQVDSEPRRGDGGRVGGTDLPEDPSVTGDRTNEPDSDTTSSQVEVTARPSTDDQSDVCPIGFLRCDQTRCVELYRRCDGAQDCFDQSDEAGCPSAGGPDEPCDRDDFRCDDGRCIEASRRCDRVADCQGHEDERDCECVAGEFRCESDGVCIEERKRCDGTPHCSDQSDERDCQEPTCPSDQFTCQGGSTLCAVKCNGQEECDGGEDELDCDRGEACTHRCGNNKCIRDDQICDRNADCEDGSDEYNCNYCDTPDDFSCDSGECISASQKCNGIPECADSSDESRCNTTMRPNGPCSVDQFTCLSNLACIDMRFYCDTFKDCEDGSDENNCPCPMSDSWQCRDGQCISSSAYCDETVDCTDGSDEVDCHYTTPRSYLLPTTSNPVDSRNEGSRYPGQGSDSRYPGGSNAGRGYPSGGQGPDSRYPDSGTGYPSGGQGGRGSDGRYPDDGSSGSGYPQGGAGYDSRYPGGSNTGGAYPSGGQGPDSRYPGGSNTGSGYPSGGQGSDGRYPDGSNTGGGYPQGGQGPDSRYPGGSNTGGGYPQGGQGSDSRYPGGSNTGGGYPQGGQGSDSRYPGGSNTGGGYPQGGQGPDSRYPGAGSSGSGYPSGGQGSDGRYPDSGSSGSGYPSGGQGSDGRYPDAGSSGSGYPSGGQGSDGRYPGGNSGSGSSSSGSGSGSRYPGGSGNGPISLNLKTYPSGQSVRHGGDVVFQCRDEGPVRAPVTWHREGRQIKEGSTDIRGRLEMFKVTSADSGVYICRADDYSGHPDSEVRVTLQVESPPVTYKPFHSCQPYEATCGDGQCIPKSAVCNNHVDCNDGSDEESCHHNGMCEPNEFQCENRKCVLKTWVCDAEDDCGDGSDERDCGPKLDGQCLPVEYTCKSQDQCIPKSFHCDHQTDCQDGSDEVGCIPVVVTMPPQPSNVKLSPGETLILRAEATGNPMPLISWRLNWGHVPAKCTSTSENGIGILTCPDMQPGDSGAYSAEAINNLATNFANPDAIVFVSKTDICPRGYFNSEARSERECIRCFCFGKSTQCRSADLFTYNMPTPLGEGGTRLIGIKASRSSDVNIDTQPISSQYFYQPLRNGATVTKSSDLLSWSNSHPYLTLPETYNGNQLKSYGGHIKYTLSPQTQVYGYDDSAPTIIIKGKYGNLFHINRSSGTKDINVEARFTPNDWSKSADGSTPASREDIMMVLDDIEMILLRADMNNAGVNITDFAMESAEHFNAGMGAASLVEECTCPKGYEGLSCQKCASGFARKKVGPWLGNCEREECPPGTYGDPSSGIPCNPCPCPLTNRENQFARTCSLGSDGSVICDCFPGYAGTNCEACAEGYEGNPLLVGNTCQPKQSDNCNPVGTKSIRPPDECVCKDNVEGRYCDQCKKDSFYLSDDFSHGCALCFCTGVSQQCKSSSYRRKTTSIQFNTPTIVDQVKIYNSAPAGLPGSVRYSAPKKTDLQPQLLRGELTLGVDRSARNNVYYWSMPVSFAGDKVTSYGGFLRYTLKNVPSSVDPRYRNTAADVQLISDNQLTFHYFGDFSASHDRILNASVQFLEKGWQRQDGKEVTREHFLLALADVQAILIKATYGPGQISSPVSASIETAEPDAYGPAAYHVEQCECPAGYVGTSCEDCSPGYTRSSSGLYLEHCEPCECNGKSDMCDPETGVCYDCADNTDGDQCELCKPGYERDGYGNCVESYRSSTRRPCTCDPRGTNVPCDNDDNCICKQNVEGSSCDRCRPGTFGLDESNPDGCLSCYCSGVTTDCHEGTHYTRMPLAAPVLGDDYGGFTITDLKAERVIKDNFAPLFEQSELMYNIQFPPDVELYWSLPVFPGNRVLSYGGSINLRQKFSSETDPLSERGTDAVLDGGDISIYWTNPNQFNSSVSYAYQIPLKEDNWFILNTATPATRSDFMKVLRNLKRVLVRATVARNIYETTIADVFMDTAIPSFDALLPTAKGIEICMCPPGYIGTSCESCKPGFYKDQLGYCRECPCNGQECQLDSSGQVVCNCQPPYTGSDCSTIGGDSSVAESTTRSPPAEPTVSVTITNPSIRILEVGSSVNFTCIAQSRYSRGRLPISWSKKDGFLPVGRTIIDNNNGVLQITNLQVSDSGLYICETKDGMNTAQATATLRVPGNEMTFPSVEIFPSVKEYYEGDRIELECRVRGNPTPTIRWMRGSNKPLPLSGENRGSWFIVDSARIEDAGEYRCVASNTVGSDGRTAMVTVRPRPSQPTRETLTVSNTSPSVEEGNSIRIVCTGTANIPPGAINWFRQDNADFPSNVRSENGVLFIEYAEPSNQGVYICRSLLTGTAPIPILVTVIQANPVPESANISLSVERLTLPTGGSGTVECNVVGRPLPLVKWSKHDGSFGPQSSQRGNSLIINDAQDSDKGYYFCEAVVNGNPIAKAYVFVDIERREPPKVEIWPQGEQSVQLGGQYELHCRVLGGTPEPYVTWNRNGGRPLSSSTQIQPHNVLRFQSIEVNDEGEYTCTARNDAGSQSASAVIKVRSPPEITITPTNQLTPEEGSPFTVECRANGYPEPMVSISFNGYEVSPPQPGHATLHVSSASSRDNGYYTCTATSVAGSITDQFLVDVSFRGDGGNFDPDPEQQFPDEGSGDSNYPDGPDDGQNDVTKSYYVIEGQPEFSISCNETGNVRWDRDDNQPFTRNVFQSGTRLIFRNVQRSDSGLYVCSIIDQYNEVRQAVYTSVEVVGAPKITLVPPSQTVQPGQSPTVECIVTGDNIIQTTWRPYDREAPSRMEVRGNKLIFHHIEVEDAGKYECIVRGQYANNSATAEVIVSEDSDRTWVSHDNEQWAHAGAAVHLSCNLTLPNTRIVWTKDGKPLPRSVTRKSDGSLFLRLAHKSDTGRYLCSVRDVYGRVLTSNYIDLHIQGYECLETEFRCYDDSSCVDEHLLCDGRRDCQDNSDEENCLWRDKRFSDTIQKSLTHDGPRDSESQQLVSIEKPTAPFRVGDNVHVQCTIKHRDVRVQWIRLGTNQYVDSRTFGNGAVLIINTVTNADAGTYRCIGSDSRGGSFYDEFELRVESGSSGPNYPGFSDRDNMRIAEYSANLHDVIDLPCYHNLEEPATIEWRREPLPLPAEFRANQPTLHFESVSETDAGTYVCRVSNERLSVETMTILTVKGVLPRFGGQSYIALQSLKDAFRQFEFEISFKPVDANGLILYNSQNQGRTGDYIALQLRDGVPEFFMNTGTDSTTQVRYDRPLQLNVWHTIRIRRTGTKVTMDVDNKGPFVGESQDQWAVLDLKQPLYIGGVPDYDQLPAELAGASGLIGCVSMLILGRDEINIMIDNLEAVNVDRCDSCIPNICQNNGFCQEYRNERGYVCNCAPGFAGLNCDRTGEACRPNICGPGKCSDTDTGYRCACPVTHTGKNCETRQLIEYPAFSGSSYVAIKSPETSRSLRMSMNIKAASPLTDGIIMYCSESNRGYGGFTSLVVHDGKLEFRYDLGGGNAPIVLVSNRTLPTNEWTNVNIARVGPSVSLKINSVHLYEQRLPPPYNQQLTLETPIFLGGVDESYILNNNTGVTEGFYGCIKDINVFGQAVNIINQTIQSANVHECVSSADTRGDIPEGENLICQCRNGGQCTSPSEPTLCSCPAGYTGQYCEQRAPQTMIDPCLLKPCRNGGTCRPNPSARMNHTCDCGLGFAGLYCQMPLPLLQSVAFSGNGYLELPASQLAYNLPTEPALIAMAIHTTNDGVLLYQKEAQVPSNYGDYLLLRIERGLVVLDWDLGGGRSSVTVNGVYVNDGERHKIVAMLFPEGKIEITVDDGPRITEPYSGISTVMNADSNIYLGGIPDSLNAYAYPGFNGCIEQVELMETRAIQLGDVAVAGRNAQRCKDSYRDYQI